MANTSPEQVLIDKIRTLNPDQQHQVIQFIQTMEAGDAPVQRVSARELMKLPYEERMKLAQAALARTADDDVELFEANEIIDAD